MSAVPQKSLIHQAYQSYLSSGFALVPIGNDKRPIGTAWNTAENVWTRVEQIDENTGVGLAHAFSTPTTMALDIDALPIFKEMCNAKGIDLAALLDAPDAVGIESGNPGHAKLLFRLPFPMPSKRIMQGGRVVAEFRCATSSGETNQDVLPSLAIHPKTGEHYRWAGAGHYTRIPAVPPAIWEWWSSIVAEDTPDAPRAPTTNTVVDMDELRSAVNHIDPSCDRKTWIEVGFALATVDAYDLWNEWSKLSTEKYPGEPTMRHQWASFRNDKASIVTVASIYHHANEAGWQRPPPNVSKMFGPVTPAASTAAEVADEIRMGAKRPVIDLQLWPDVLVRRSLEVSDEVGCDPVVPLMAGLAAISAAVDKRTSLRINPTWKVPPNFWVMTIGEPSDKKTPGSKPMFTPLYKLELADKERYQTEMLIWQGKEAKYAAEMKAYKEWQASPESGFPGAIPPQVTPLPPQPQSLRLIVTDATTQKLFSMAEGRPAGFLLYLDEMNRWLSKLSDSRTTDDRTCWIKGYETGPATMDRVGSGTTEVDNFALSVYGNCQPQVFMQNVVPASADGIMQRFLPVPLDPSKNKVWTQALPEFMSSAYDYEQLIVRTHALPTMDYTFSADAMEVFQSFSHWVIGIQKAEKTLSSSVPYQTALGKLDGQAARLILLLHIINDPYNTVISAHTVAVGVAIMREFFYTALRYTFLEVGQQSDPMAKNVLDLVIQWAGERETMTLADLRRVKYRDDAGRAPWQTDQLLRVVMDDLCSRGYAAIHTDHPRFPVWAVNPQLATIFKREREQIIRAKMAVQDHIVDHVERRTGKRFSTERNPVIGSIPFREKK